MKCEVPDLQKTKAVAVPIPQNDQVDPKILDKEKDPDRIKVQGSLGLVNQPLDKLPSRGLSYPKGTTILHRAYKFGEIKRINQSKNVSTQQGLEEILNGIEVVGMDKLELTASDALYIGLLRKISTLGTTQVILKYRCGKCKKNGSHKKDTNQLVFDDLLADYSDEEACLPVEADFSFGTLKFSPMTVKEYFLLIEKKLEEDVSAKMAVESSLDFDEAYKKFEDMEDSEDMMVLDQVDKLMYHGLQPVKFYCKNKLGDSSVCQNSISLELDGGQALILPFRKRKVDVKSRIRLGKRT